MTLRKFLLSILFLSFTLYSLGQTIDNKQIKQDTISSISKDTISKNKLTKFEIDSIRNAKLSASSTIVSDTTKEKTPIIKKAHSPAKATLLSTFIPGLGQIYNKQAWKVPVIYAAGGTAAYFAIYNNKGAQKFKKEYTLRANGITEGRNPEYTNFPDQSIYNLYYAYEKNFELSIFAGAAVYLLNIVDAMVYGHLFDYDISPNLSLNLTPYCLPSYNTSPSFGLSMRFNLK